MKAPIALLVICACVTANCGCSQNSTSTTKEEVKTPGGKTTITTQQDVKKTGDHKD